MALRTMRKLTVAPMPPNGEQAGVEGPPSRNKKEDWTKASGGLQVGCPAQEDRFLSVPRRTCSSYSTRSHPIVGCWNKINAPLTALSLSFTHMLSLICVFFEIEDGRCERGKNDIVSVSSNSLLNLFVVVVHVRYTLRLS